MLLLQCRESGLGDAVSEHGCIRAKRVVSGIAVDRTRKVSVQNAGNPNLSSACSYGRGVHRVRISGLVCYASYAR